MSKYSTLFYVDQWAGLFKATWSDMSISIGIDITIYMLPSIEIIASMNCKCIETKALVKV